ncbi:MAG: LPS assembly lipoprotein LptE [Zoogloeaceae bacterium]|jgi:LPS-assembly lipoprotein|nr:LPS assembly lipoprotein LptE [Zoogloeaceae bacterium]
MNRFFRLPLVCLATLWLAACGFHLQGAIDMPYDKMYINIPPSSALGAELRRLILAHQPTALVEEAKDAQVVLSPIAESDDQEIAALTAEGNVREYTLIKSYSFRLTTPDGKPLSPIQTIRLTREMTYDDNQTLSKDQEREFLQNDMQTDLAGQILRRLSALARKMP